MPNRRNLVFNPADHPHVCLDGNTYPHPRDWCASCNAIPYDLDAREFVIRPYPTDPTWVCPGCEMGYAAGWHQNPWEGRGQVVHNFTGQACPYQTRLADIADGALVVHGRTIYVLTHKRENGGQAVAVLVDPATREINELGLSAAALVLMPEAPAVFAEATHPMRQAAALVAVTPKRPRKAAPRPAAFKEEPNMPKEAPATAPTLATVSETEHAELFARVTAALKKTQAELDAAKAETQAAKNDLQDVRHERNDARAKLVKAEEERDKAQADLRKAELERDGLARRLDELTRPKGVNLNAADVDFARNLPAVG